MATQVFIVFYSTYGHIYQLALAEKEGAESVPGVEVILLQARHSSFPATPRNPLKCMRRHDRQLARRHRDGMSVFSLSCF